MMNEIKLLHNDDGSVSVNVSPSVSAENYIHVLEVINDLTKGISNKEFILRELLKPLNIVVNDDPSKSRPQPIEVNNTIDNFIQQYPYKIIGSPTRKVYNAYLDYCKTGGFEPLNHIQFSKMINKFYGYASQSRWINGESYRVFVKKH